ncbi:type II toxin-antitoxin system YafQ family toxin (plasmid) [Campylobacter fetus]|uniref:Type II toxin-antitoxin system YafQ family toxin n=1 Tax=Campylobacter fetus TaxID=196 RepID=A0A974RKF0_CAMFE|nr:type II toxin-antitoxin system YafQ family toxin [Campylobacter fetus]OCS32575.1 addiction module toxin RelE [Campylobacter fetus subsp. venerealis]OCS40073.1 addiction module toxin RelE [Campylobacter fetus subsp. venerealis cfvi02/298]AHE95244.1 addiction module toxin, RelE/StbE family [Campylobacter fetus subsp. venerealis cfvi03/293]OCS22582.1 addiction module toxin RelE [Campylobacter fetus subsp. venerealis cfvi9825]QMS59831.1 type II toxin-antitoxin system YafQ family toxin [Campylob
MAKYEIIYSKEYRKAIKKLDKSVLPKIEYVIDKLANDEILETKFKDHQLKGEYKDFRECHIKPDLLLIYRKNSNLLILIAFKLGSHSEIFK